MRPRLHLTAEEGWINDPLGLTYHGGRYHLFFQHVPGQTQWSPNCHWGHATSDDLLHWTRGPIALAPGDGDDGCWSGSIVTDPPTLFYTTVDQADVQIGRVRVAHPDADWTTWSKGEVLAAVPPGVDAVAYRDPFVFVDGDQWRMLMGAGLRDGTATALLYTSPDLRHWTYDGELVSRPTSETEPVWTGTVWECPQLFPLGDKWIFTVSVWEPFVPHYEAYAVGSYRDGRFVPERWSRLTYGPSYYAGSTYTDADGRRGLIYWLRGINGRDWAGANSIPHLLSLRGETLVAEPHPNLLALRGPVSTVEPESEPVELSSVADIEWRLDNPAAEAQLRAIDAQGNVILTLAVTEGHLQANEWSMPLDGAFIRILLDSPVAELFTHSGSMALPLTSTPTTLTATGQGHVSVYRLDT